MLHDPTSGYKYEQEKYRVFLEENQVQFLKVRDNVRVALEMHGAFKMVNLLCTGDSWLAMAFIDRLLEIGEIKEIMIPNVMAQNRVFVKGRSVK